MNSVLSIAAYLFNMLEIKINTYTADYIPIIFF